MIKEKYSSVYTSSSTIEKEEISINDYSKTCILFSAQSSVYPKMFEQEVENIKELKKYVEIADGLCKELKIPPVSKYIKKAGSLNEIETYIVRNLCLFTIEYSLFKYLLNKGTRPELVTGHSFGEYSSIAACEIYTFKEMFRIIYERETSCPNPHKLGVFIAVAANKDRVSKIINEIGEISVINSKNQIVISISNKNTIKEVQEKFESQNIKSTFLKDMPQPYHSTYMKKVSRDLEFKIKELGYKAKPPKYNFLSSVTKKIYQKGHKLTDEFEEILSSQLVTQVDFISQSKIISEECYRVIEVGPKDTFIKLFMENISGRENSTFHVSDYLPKFTKKVEVLGTNEEILEITRRAVEKVTGHKADNLNLEDMFQEDLGIDSIKKTEILFNVLEETGKDFSQEMHYLQSSQFTNIGELVNALSKEKKHEKTKKEKFITYFGKWEKAKDSIASYKRTRIVSYKDLIKDLAFEKRMAILINNINPINTKEIIDAFDKLRNAKGLSSVNDLFIITNDENCELFNGVWALFKSVRFEVDFKVKAIISDNLDDKYLNTIISQEINTKDEIVKYKNNTRYISKIKENNSIGKKEEKFQNILAIGGAKGITREILIGLPKNYTNNIFIIGSSPKEKIEHNLEKISKKHKIQYYQSDVLNKKNMQNVIKSIKKQYKKIDLIIFGAGIQVSKNFKEQTKKEIKEQLDVKVNGIKNIIKVAEMFNAKIITFSSIASQYGNNGQSVYGAANAIMDSLVHKYKEGKTIIWPAWDGIGMMNNPVYIIKMKENGLSLLKSEEASAIFNKIIFSSQKINIVNTLSNHYRLLSRKNEESYLKPLTSPSIIYQKDYRIVDNMFFLDHSIEGTVYIPAAEMILLAYKVGKSCYSSSVKIEELVISNPIILRGNTNVFVEVEPKIESLNVKVKTNIYHMSAKILINNKKVEQLEIKTSGKSLKSPYKHEKLFHGPKFQILSNIKISGKNLFSKITINETNTDKRLMLLLDACFQAAGLLENKVSVPIGAEKIEILEELMNGNDYQLIVDNKKATIVNNDNKMVLRINGIKMGAI